MEGDIVTKALVIFPSALDDLVVTWVGTTMAVVPSSDAVILTAAIVDIVGKAVVDAFACVIMDELAAIQKHEHVDTQACACCMQHIKKKHKL